MRKRKVNVSAIRNRNDKLFSLVCRARDGWRCRWCKKTRAEANLNVHHVHSRRYLATRWRLLNGITLCCGCHFKAEHLGIIFAEWLKGDIGKKRYRDLLSMFRERCDFKAGDFLEAENYLNEQAKRYGVTYANSNN